MQDDKRPVEGEPCFTLMGRDPDAPGMVRAWADEREDAIARGERPETDRERVQNARNVARAMDVWRVANAEAAPWRRPMPLFETARDPLRCPFCGDGSPEQGGGPLGGCNGSQACKDYRAAKFATLLQRPEGPTQRTPCQDGKPCDNDTCLCG